MKIGKGGSSKARRMELRRNRQTPALGMTFLQISILFLCMVLSVTTVSQNARARSWEPVQEISTDEMTEMQRNVSIAADESKVHVVWADGEDGDPDIYYRCFNGTGWQPEVEISNDTGTEIQMKPSIAVSGDNVHVVWAFGDGLWPIDWDIYYRYFNGTSWQPELEISTDIGRELQWVPSIAVDGDKVHVVWQEYEGGDWDIYYRLFDGTNWGLEQEISSDAVAEWQKHPSVVVNGDRVHVVWQELGNWEWDIYYRHFNGTAWQPELEISTDTAIEEDQRHPSVAVEGDRVHVVWADEGGGDYDIYYRYFAEGSWQPEQEVSIDGGIERQFEPSIQVGGGDVHVVWRDEGGGDYDIYHRYNDGTDWKEVADISSDLGVERQANPSIAVGGSAVHVVWEDERDGDEDIYYTRSAWDITPPESNTTPLSPYWKITSTFDVDWTATDDQDIANISLDFRYSSENSSWSGWEEWAYDDTISGTFATGNFSFVAPYGDGFYEYYTVASDSSGNNETPPLSADSIVGVDTTPPTGSIIVNNGDEWTTSTSVTLTLTCSDSLSGVDKVRYSNDGLWDVEPWELPSSAKAWTLTSIDGTKTVYYQIRDNAGLLSTTYSDGVNLDTTPPSGSILISNGDAWTTSPWVSLTLTYSDATSGVSQVRYSNDGVWDNETWESPAGTKEWPLTFGDGAKTVYYQIRDNVSLLSMTYSDDIGLDTTEPIGFDVINNGDQWTNSTSITLTLGYLDSTSGVAQVRYTNDGVWDTEIWQGPSTTKSWTLVTGDGIKIVHYQIRDLAGLESITYLDYIGLDTMPPTGSIIINNGDELTASTSVTLTLAYSDSFSGVAQVRYSNDGVWDTEVWESPSTTKAWAMTSGDGIKTVYYQIRDNAGLVSATYSDDIELDTKPPTIERISPPDGATGSEVTTNIEVTFSERMNKSATTSSFRLMKDTIEVGGAVSWTTDEGTIFFIPSKNLEYNTTYQIIITTWAKDMAGNSLVTDSETTFTTKEVGEEPGEEPLTTIDYWWIILVLIIVTLIVVFIAWRTRKKQPSEEKDSAREGTTSEATQSGRLGVEEDADSEEGLE